MRLHRFFDFLAGFTILFLVMVIAFLVYVKDRGVALDEPEIKTEIQNNNGTDYSLYNEMLMTTDVSTEENIFVGPGFVFSYDMNATVKKTDGLAYTNTYIVTKDGVDNIDGVTYYPLGLPEDEWCGSGESYSYCDSTGDPSRRYVFKKDGKGLVIDIVLDQSMEPYFINLDSVEIL